MSLINLIFISLCVFSLFGGSGQHKVFIQFQLTFRTFLIDSLTTLRKEIHAAYGMTVICLYEMDKARNKIDPDTEILARYMMRGLGCDNLE